jgi:hypothetical protein
VKKDVICRREFQKYLTTVKYSSPASGKFLSTTSTKRKRRKSLTPKNPTTANRNNREVSD